jgi:hypothetical protein
MKRFSISVAAVALVLVASNLRAQQAPPAAQKAQPAAQQDQQGQLASSETAGKIERVDAAQNLFTMRDKKGQQWMFHTGRDARVQVDGKDAKLGDLREGQEVTVTYRQTLTEIRAGANNEATDKAQQQKGQLVSGQIQSVEKGQQICLRDQNGKDHTFQIGQNTRVQLNGKNATLADLQQGQQVTATRHLVANEVRSAAQNR